MDNSPNTEWQRGASRAPQVTPLDFGHFVPIDLSEIYEVRLRDWFAGQALQGILAASKAIDPNECSGSELTDIFTKACYCIADAMMESRTEEK